MILTNTMKDESIGRGGRYMSSGMELKMRRVER